MTLPDRGYRDRGRLALFTTNPVDYAGLEKLVRVITVTRPPMPHEKKL
jgi:hypothetical protein